MDTMKDNKKAYKDMTKICNRPTLKLTESSETQHAPFYLRPKMKKEVIRWLKKWKFPNGCTAGSK